jgi:ribonuclease J
MPFLLKEMQVPVFGTSFTIELLREKLREHQLDTTTVLQKICPGDIQCFGPFRVEFIHVNHSIVGGVGLAIETAEGTLVHSGDFRIDHTPVDGNRTDMQRFAHYGERGVLALFSDSTNVEKEGYTLSESGVKKTLEELFRSSKGRLITAVFASNVARIQQIIHLAVKFNRRVLFSGKSMKANVRIAKEEGLMVIPEGLEVSESGIRSLKDEEVVLITTGSQGEPLSSLARMAQDRHKNVAIKEGDMVILSSRFIPGNEKAITAIINRLYRMGAEVVYEKVSHIHTSGHAYREELKMMLNLVRPRFFIPIHGEYRHLVQHIQLAREVGLTTEQLLLIENGTPVQFENGKALIAESVPSGRILVDGKGVGDVGDLVLRDRRRLSGDGMVIAIMAVDNRSGEIVYGPDLVSRGFVFEDQGEIILEEAKVIIHEVLGEIEGPFPVDWDEIGREQKRRLKRFFYKAIERRPLILPIIIPL